MCASLNMLYGLGLFPERGDNYCRIVGFRRIAMAGILLPLKLIAIKERLSALFVEKGHLDVLDGALSWWARVASARTFPSARGSA